VKPPAVTSRFQCLKAIQDLRKQDTAVKAFLADEVRRRYRYHSLEGPKVWPRHAESSHRYLEIQRRAKVRNC